MTFEVKNQLMQLVQNDAVAYKIAFEFVDDSADKLSVFSRALQEQNQGGLIEARSSAAAQVAKARWGVMYPEPEVKK